MRNLFSLLHLLSISVLFLSSIHFIDVPSFVYMFYNKGIFGLFPVRDDYKIFCKHSFNFSVDCSVFNLLWLYQCSRMAIPFAFPPATYESSSCSHFCKHLVLLGVWVIFLLLLLCLFFETESHYVCSTGWP
jgi:hypothetical protein